MNEFYNRHYITIDAQSHITAGWSDGPRPDKDITDAICINEQGGYQFRLFPAGEENPPLCTMDGIPLYRWDGEGAVVRRSEDEIAADRAARPAPEPDKLTQSQLAIAELAQVVEESNTANQLAIAELAEALMGGES